MKTLAKALIAGSLFLIAGCDTRPQLKGAKDFTGDGINDIMLMQGNQTWLFIGKKDSGYTMAKKKYNYDWIEGENPKEECFITDDGIKYSFDGKFYIESPKDSIQ